MGNRTSLQAPGSPLVVWRYDPLNRLQSVNDGSTTIATYRYDPLSRLRAAEYGNGTRSAWNYEADNDLSSTIHTINGTDWALAFTRNGVHQIVGYGASDASLLDPGPSQTTTLSTTRYTSN